jgi:phage terminase small subunit
MTSKTQTKAAKKPAPKAKQGTSKEAAAIRRKIFVEAYIANGGNATEAAKKGGYSEKTARSQGQRLLTDVDIKAQVSVRREEAIAKAEEETGITVAGILRELKSLVHSDLRGAFNPVTGALLLPHLWPDDVAKAMSSVKVVEMAGAAAMGGVDGLEHVPMYTKEVKFWDKNSAIDKAMKHLGMFEKDNEQKASALAGLPREMVEAVAARLRAMS